MNLTKLSQYTCEDVLKGSVDAKILEGSKEIEATFTPKGVTLKEAAHICDCERFEWVQHFQPSRGTALWTVQGDFANRDPKLRVDQNTGQLFAGVGFTVISEDDSGSDTQYIDPIINGSMNRYARTSKDVNGQWNIGITPQPWSDSLPFADWPVPIPSDGTTLKFEDAPKSTPTAFKDANDFTQFHTQLVGVTGTSTYKTFGPGWDTNFRWKHNVTYDGVSQITDLDFYSTRIGTGPIATGGKLFDLTFDSVPEPSTAYLLVLGFFMGLQILMRPAGRKLQPSCPAARDFRRAISNCQ
ncbi:MAG: hypothetical protein WD851_25075 [Pirellulales bacterium]